MSQLPRLTLPEEFRINVERRRETKDPHDRAIYTTLIDMILDEWNTGKRQIIPEQDYAVPGECDGA